MTLPSLSRVTVAISAAKRHRDAGSPAIERSGFQDRLLDPDQPVVERFAGRFARIDCSGKAFIDVGVAKFLELFLVPAPERFENHGISGFGAFDEVQQVETAIGGSDRAQAFFHRKRNPGKFTRPHLLLRKLRLRSGTAGQTVGIGLFESRRHRLFFMLGAAAKHGIEPKAQKSGDHGQDDNFDNHVTKDPFTTESAALHHPNFSILPEIGTHYK